MKNILSYNYLLFFFFFIIIFFNIYILTIIDKLNVLDGYITLYATWFIIVIFIALLANKLHQQKENDNV